MSIESVMPSNQLILCHPLLLLPSIFSIIRGFSNESVLHNRWPNIGASGLASVLLMNILDWFPLGWTGLISLQSKGLSRVLQHHSSKASSLQHSAFFTVQLSRPYTTTGKTIVLIILIFVGKVMSLLFMLSRLPGFPDSSVGKESVCNGGDHSSIPGSGRSSREGIGYPLWYSWVSLVAQLVKNPPAVCES